MKSAAAAGGPSRNPGLGPAGRATSTSSTASPSSSSSAVSESHLGLDSLHQQQIGSRQSLQQQFLLLRLSDQSSPQAAATSDEAVAGNHVRSEVGPAQMPQQQHGFTKQQLRVLKSQILAFRRLKKGEDTLPQELLQAISPPPLELQMQQPIHPA